MTSKDLMALIGRIDYEPQRYSGRGMYGAACVGVVVTWAETLSLGVKLAMEAGLGTDDHMRVLEDIHDLMARAKTDDMAREAIVYWPNMPWPEKNSKFVQPGEHVRILKD